ncbi:DUF7426 family protein [Thermomonospora cellulosilytica]|uniref:DUF7426 domain-containing protein n=1 Tax=Thermomonospora cellulosilytica TaxID=1411118 RepID=A0A7W3R8U0_9ACTN|nr:hypothetical protein [Thermomonospora cellulosilytica]MBA9003660.1 hypothetical protein [Thermomonospora cellulosilytica]
MTAFKDLGDALHGAYIELPLGGRVYRIDDVSAETALYVERVMSVGASLATEQAVSDEDIEVLDDDGERDLYRRVMGDAYDEMIRDGVNWQAIKHAGMTVMVWILRDEATAAKYWESGGGATAMGEALAPAAGNRASRRASQAMARKTPSPASTNGTRASRPRPPRDRSRGRRS